MDAPCGLALSVVLEAEPHGTTKEQMIEQIAYLALLSAPELAGGAVSLAGEMVEGVGRRFAAGIYDEISGKLTRDTSLLGGAISRAISGQMTSAVESIQATAASALSSALRGEGAALASAEELRILRKLAADASDGRDIGPVLTELRQFYASQTAGRKER
ncbi:hypothetical protein A9R05_41850 (plasmid) [Burkholderia sp. KK1]|uniref:hypothetical protein n=1 Tax=Burkholderia sp. M701 TaxID=326454 RepID=UPI000979909C|nr:hypothetical protein [Burkholderia sp. M701]AQH05570.1 hypothetical protein A9R05_41850 [Burkholderia sp. KK1]